MTSAETIIHITTKNNKSPGPQDYQPPAEFGNACPKYTISSKTETKRDDQPTPELQNLPSTIGDGPKYSLHGRPKEPKQQPTPGPDYLPPAFGSESKKSSFHGYVKQRGKGGDSPGPGQYAVPSTIGEGKKFSMKGRVFPPEEGIITSPGPSQYDPNYTATMPSIRQNAIRGRPAERAAKDTGPGPGEYVIPSTLKKNAPCFHARTPESRTFSGPGPAAYETQTQIGADSRKYSMRSRIDTKKNTLDIPYNDVPSTFGSGPKATLHGRTESRKVETTPGPNYMPPSFGSDTRKYSFGNRRDISKRATSALTPGPGEYQIPSYMGQGKKFSLKGREKMPESKDQNPGPANYTPEYDKLLAGRKTEIGRRFHEKKQQPMGKYYMLPEPDRGPAYTIGRRDNLDVQAGK